MSLVMVREATIEGLNGPYFTALIEPLNAVLSDRRIGWSHVTLSDALAGVDGFQGFGDIGTTISVDGYSWFSSISFAEGPITVVITLPRAQDWNQKDGSQLDRSAAAYVKPPHELGSHVDAVLTRVTRALEETREYMLKPPVEVTD